MPIQESAQQFRGGKATIVFFVFDALRLARKDITVLAGRSKSIAEALGVAIAVVRARHGRALVIITKCPRPSDQGA